MSADSPFWRRESHRDRQSFLHGRARIVAALRAWFAVEGFIEVEPNALVASPGAETHLQAFEVGGRYLHTSPEFAMKKLLAAGEEKIFFLGKVWRAGETGPLHAPEFTMLEWYRAGAPYERVMDDCIALLRVAARTADATHMRWRERTCDPFSDAEKLTVREAFARFSPSPRGEGAGGGVNLNADRLPSSSTTLHSETAEARPTPYPLPSWGGDDFSATLVTHIEPNLGIGAPTLLTEYPISEAALARLCQHDASVAERFELYACGVELANGFGELTDPIEQRARLIAAMDEKHERYGTRWPIDEDFLAALAHMPPASGVAMGVDRLVMLAVGARTLRDVLWTPA
jgi:elongation factor P--(R)-beta-lysine ligase